MASRTTFGFLILLLLVAIGGCASLVSDDDPGEPEFSQTFQPNTSVEDAAAFDFRITNRGEVAGQAYLEVIATAPNGSTFRKTKVLQLEPEESKTVTVIFEQFKNISGPTIRASVNSL